VKDIRNQLEQHAAESRVTPPPRKAKTGPPPKPPVSSKPTVPPKPRTVDRLSPPKQQVEQAAESPSTPSYVSERPIAPPRNKTKKVEIAEPGDESDSTSIYVAPTAAPLDPAMDVSSAAPARRREQRRLKEAARDAKIIENLRAICTDADPTKLYRNMVKVGQG
jgi:p21-activated kinase 1